MKHVFTLLLLLNYSCIWAQAPAIQWQKTFGGSGNDRLVSMKRMPDGSFILGGFSTSGISGNKTTANAGLEDYWIVKIDNAGNKLWEKNYGGQHNDYLASVILTSDGGYLAIGGSESGATGSRTCANKGTAGNASKGRDFWVLKLDTDGVIQWQQCYGTSANDGGLMAIQQPDNGFLLGGIAPNGTNSGNNDGTLKRVNQNGTLLWEKNFGGPQNHDALTCMTELPGARFAVVGWSESAANAGNKTAPSRGGRDTWVLKTDSMANIIWQNTVGGTGTDYSIGNTRLSCDGGVLLNEKGEIVFGNTSSSDISGNKSVASQGSSDYWIVAMDTATGAVNWQNGYGGSGADIMTFVIQTSDSGYLLGGYSLSGVSGDKDEASKGSNDFWILKLDKNRNLEWQKTIGGSDDDQLMSVIETGKDEYLLGGYSKSGISGDKTDGNLGDYDWWIIKLAPTTPCTLTASITPSVITPVCAGDSVILRANKVTGASYEWRNGSAVLPGNSDSVIIKATGSYTVKLTNSICNVISAAVAVQVNTLPDANQHPSGAQAICTGDTLVIHPPAANMNYRWYQGGTLVGTGNVYNAVQAGAYTLKVTDPSTGCSDSSFVSTDVSLLALPDASITPSGAQLVCAGDSLILQASGLTTGVTYEWSRNGTVTPGIQTGSYTAALSGSYTLKASITASGCEAVSTIPAVITVKPLPVVTVTPSGTQELCQGSRVQLTASAGPGYSYEWKRGQAVVVTGNICSADTAGMYYVVVRDPDNCTDSSAVVDVRVLPAPRIAITPEDTAFCSGGFVRYEVQTTDTGLDYRWKKDGVDITGADLPYYEADRSGVYGVHASRSSLPGCADSIEDLHIIVYPLPVPAISWDGTTLRSVSGFASYQWYTAGQPIAGATDSVLVPDAKGAYMVEVTDTNGCSGSSVIYNVQQTSGINIMSGTGKIRVYPNPVTSGIFHITFPEPADLVVTGTDGRVLYRQEKTRDADISALPDGVYLLRIELNGRLLGIERLVKMH